MQIKGLARLATGAAVLAMSVGVALAVAPSASAAPPPTATGTPTTGLHDGDIMAMSGSGFPADVTIQIIECQGTAASPPLDDTSCDGISLDTQATSSNTGTFVNQAGDPNGDTGYQVYELGTPGSLHPNSGITCNSTTSCVLYVGVADGDFSQPHTWVDVSFGAYGNGPKLFPATAASTAFAGGPAVTLNLLTNAHAFDSNGVAETITAAGPWTTPTAPAFGTVTVSAAGVASYVPNATIPGGTTKDTFTAAGTAVSSAAGTAGTYSGPPVNQAPATFTVNIGHGNNPTLVAQTGTLPKNLAGSATTFSTTNTTPNGVLTGAVAKDSTGVNETLISVALSGTAASFGTVTGPTGPNNDFTYTLNTPDTAPANGGTDHFTITATYAVAGSTAPTFAASQTENVVVPQSYPSSCDVTANPSCVLTQQIDVPVTGADLTMYNGTIAGAVGLPVDTLNGTSAGGTGPCTSPGIVLNGQPQYACGAMTPITVVNARGTASGWNLTGEVSDFLDQVAPAGTTCDTVATYSRDCIPGGNLGWGPVAAVAQGLVPGDVAAVTNGATIPPPGVVAPSANPNAVSALNGFSYQPYTVTAGVSKPTTEPSPLGGLHNAAMPLCTTAATTSGGTFVCGASLTLAVPASAAADAVPGFQAFLVLTLA